MTLIYLWLHNEQNLQECDATMYNSSILPGPLKIIVVSGIRLGYRLLTEIHS
jgi:hypothetical protein